MPLEHIIALGVAAIAILVLVTIGLNLSLEKDQTELAQTKIKADQMAERVSQMEKEVDLRILDESLVQANKRLTGKVEARKAMLSALDSLVIEEGTEQFSSLMFALARQTSKNLWLDHINVGLSGKTMVLSGRTLDAGEVPAYLQKLRNETAFVGRSFTLFNLEVDDQKKSEIHFELKSEIKSQEDLQDATASQKLVYPTLSAGGAP